jgi:hypothetical protein
MFFPGRALILKPGCQASLNRSAGKSVELGRVGGAAVSWNDSGARTGPHEIGLIAKIDGMCFQFRGYIAPSQPANVDSAQITQFG